MPRKPSLSRVLLKLIHQSTSPVYIVNQQRQIIFVSPALEELLGYTAEQLVGLTCDFSSADEGIAAVADSLYPTLSAFDGVASKTSLTLLSSAGQAIARTATFTPLDLPTGERVIMAIVTKEPESGESLVSHSLKTSEMSSEQLHDMLARLRRSQLSRYHTDGLLGTSDAMQRVRQQIELAAQSQSRVLVTGSEGSGREHVARTIHLAREWKNMPLPVIDCPVMDAELLQNSLTGILRRSLPRDASDLDEKVAPATVLLANVDRLKADAQQELASFLRLPSINLLTIATSRMSLQKLAQKGKFRRDLAFALSTLTIALPPLKARMEDLPLLAQWFVEQENLGRSQQLAGLAPSALELLSACDWPGQLDQLASVIRIACQRATGRHITAADLPDQVHLAAGVLKHPPREVPKIVLDDFLADIEKQLLERALREARNNKSRAAELLGINRQRLLRRMAQLGLAPATSADVGAEEPVVFEPLPEEEAR